MSKQVTRRDYCQYLLVTQINYTLTYFADHTEQFSHDAVNRYLRREKIPPRLLWENVRGQVVATPTGFVVFDDTVLDKNASFAIELVRSQYSGNAKAVIKGLGVVTGVYVQPEPEQFWLIDYRLYDPAGDGKSKLDHVRDMLTNVVYQQQLPFHAVLMDTWYATKDLMLFIESLGQRSYWGMILWASAATNASIPWPGAPRSWPTASASRSKASQKTTQCHASGLRCLPTARTTS
jgi:hypothetical protein